MLTLLTPTAVKFLHIFNQHEHVICLGEYQTHIHESDIQCSYHLFKLTQPFTVPQSSFDIFMPKYGHKTFISQYFFLSDFQRLHVLLRGPPKFNLI